MHTLGQNIGPQRAYNTRLRARNMEDEERAYREARFQEELDSLKDSVARLTGLLEQVLRNTSGEGTSTRPAPLPASQPEEIIGGHTQEPRHNEHAQEPRHNPAFVQPTTPIPTPAVVDAFINESHKTKSSEDVDQDKMAALEARIRAIEGIDLYDPVRAVEMCLVSNIGIPKMFRVSKFIKYTRTQCPITYLKSYCNKMIEVVDDKNNY